MSWPLQKARPEGDQETGAGIHTRMWGPDDWVLHASCETGAKEGGAGGQPQGVMYPETGCREEEGRSPTRLAPGEFGKPVQYPTGSQTAPPVPKARWLRFQTSTFPWVARRDSFILGEQRV